MSLDIKKFLLDKMIEPLKYTNTSTQDVILELVSQRLQQLYDFAERFPEVIDIEVVTEHMLEDIAKSYGHDLDSTLSVQEKRGIIGNIIETYRRRGSIESFENMYKYYGGNLPRDVRVKIPAYDLFRYSISPYSGTHRLKDGKYWRSGVFELLIRDDFNLDKLRDFVEAELAPAGAKVLYSKETTLGEGLDDPLFLGELLPHPLVMTLFIEMKMVTLRSGMQYSSGSVGLNQTGKLSGRQVLFAGQSLFVEELVSMTRKKEESMFIIPPTEVTEYFKRPLEVPINLLSGFPVIGTKVLVEDPESTLGLDSLIGKHRSYDYMKSSRVSLFNLYPQRVSSHGKLGGKNGLSGMPVGDEDTKSWLPLRYLPTKLEKLYDRVISKDFLIVHADLRSLTDIAKKRTEIYKELRVRFYGSDRTPKDILADTRIDLTDVNDNPVPLAPTGSYPGYFVLATTPLGGYALQDNRYNGNTTINTVKEV